MYGEHPDIFMKLTFFEGFVVSNNVRMSELFSYDIKFTDEVTDALVSLFSIFTHFWHKCINLLENSNIVYVNFAIDIL